MTHDDLLQTGSKLEGPDGRNGWAESVRPDKKSETESDGEQNKSTKTNTKIRIQTQIQIQTQIPK